MKRFFADTFYWIALLSPRDQWHARVRAFNETLEAYHLYTTDEVLTEFLAFYSTTDPLLRTRAAGFVRTMFHNPRLTVIPQTRKPGWASWMRLHSMKPAQISTIA